MRYHIGEQCSQGALAVIRLELMKSIKIETETGAAERFGAF